MTRSLLVLNSITYAYKAQKILDQLWIKSAVIRTPRNYRNEGCGYSLIVFSELEKAVRALKDEGINIREIVPDYKP